VSEERITKLELTDEETIYVTYCIGIAYNRLSEYQRVIAKKILDKIVKA